MRYLIPTCALVAMSFTSTAVRAVDVEGLISPGPLITAHQREARDCRSCHRHFDRGGENDLCLACHKPIARDLDESHGLHGHLPAGPTTLCRACHTEHKGAEAEISVLHPESFDHRRTDMPLEGAHATVVCSKCHAEGQAYRKAPHACIDCHRENDVHSGSLGESCGNCHTPTDWTKARFDHATTRFPLEGRHADIDCASCHPQERFDAAPIDCFGCHRFDDAHRGRLGSTCARCHQASGWKRKSFDHDKQTRFALRGAHAHLECRRCHPGDPKLEKLESSCSSCHANDDEHQGRYGSDCSGCHDPRSWKRSHFDHAKRTSFGLDGAHSKLDCDLCHAAPVKESRTPTLCVDCHATIDVHAGGEGSRCEKCHSTLAWRVTKTIDHDLTRFPLLGLHRFATCEDCHVTHDFHEAGTRCIDCHRAGDSHRTRLGEDCALCHNPNAWERWSFDHDRQTRFALSGAHRVINCLACHREPMTHRSPISKECRGCHLADSPHSDGFGRDCDRCHLETSWKSTREEH